MRSPGSPQASMSGSGANETKGGQMSDASIKVNDNGPYVLRGSFIIVDADGNPIEREGTVALCRCGQSSNKPFCDGTHNKVGFESVCRRMVDA